MNNAPTINNASVSPPPGEIEPPIPRREISFRRIANCLCLPETRAASTGTIFFTAGMLIFGLADLQKVSIPLMFVGGAMLLCGSMIAAMRHYHREFPSFSTDLELQSPLPPAPEQAYLQSDFFTSTAPPPTYEECCSCPKTPPPAYEDDSPLSSTSPALQFTYLV